MWVAIVVGLSFGLWPELVAGDTCSEVYVMTACGLPVEISVGGNINHLCAVESCVEIVAAVSAPVYNDVVFLIILLTLVTVGCC